MIWGNKTYIKRLERRHVDEMQLWGRHSDPIFYSYTMPQMNDKQKDYWYYKKTYSFTRRCYVVYNTKNLLIGYIALRDIKWFRRSSELGIVFDPNNLSCGYGTDSLKSFIRYYFVTMKMKRLTLRVAEYNTRAQKCYQNCGFEVDSVRYGEFEDQSMPIFKDNLLAEYRKYFAIDKDKLMCRFIHMYITKDMFIKNQHNYPHYTPNTCA
jgi:RimJ/RimL family protein N-acetyltransferase